MILEQETFELVVVDADGNHDSTEGTIMGGETLADFLGGAIEATDGEERIGAGADQEDEKPAESDEQKATDFFGVSTRFRVESAWQWSDGVLRGRSAHLLRIEQIWVRRDLERDHEKERRGIAPPLQGEELGDGDVGA